MPKTAIQTDSNGRLYIEADGLVFRPERAKFEYYHPKRELELPLNEGDLVMARRVDQSPFLRVAMGDEEVYWGHHGLSVDYDGNTLDPALAWDPDPDFIPSTRKKLKP